MPPRTTCMCRRVWFAVMQKSPSPAKKILPDSWPFHTESAGKTEAISICTDNKQPLNLVLTLKSQKYTCTKLMEFERVHAVQKLVLTKK